MHEQPALVSSSRAAISLSAYGPTVATACCALSADGVSIVFRIGILGLD